MLGPGRKQPTKHRSTTAASPQLAELAGSRAAGQAAIARRSQACCDRPRRRFLRVGVNQQGPNVSA